MVFLKNCEPELSYILAEILNICLKKSCFLDFGRSQWSLNLRMLKKALQLKS